MAHVEDGHDVVDVSDIVIPCASDVRRLTFLASRDCSYIFAPCMLDMQMQPRMYPLKEIQRGKGQFSLVCTSPLHVETMVHALKELYMEEPLTAWCVVVRARNTKHHTCFRGWTVLTEWTKGHKFHMAPDAMLRRCPQRVRAYYLPAKPHTVNAVLNAKPTTMSLRGHVNGYDALLLFDSGATFSYMSHDFATKVGAKWEESNATACLANDASVRIFGHTVATIRVTNCLTRWRLNVMPLSNSFDVILGEDWMHAHKADLRYSINAISLLKGRRRYTLRDLCPTNQTRQPLLSAIQLKRDLRTEMLVCIVQVKAIDEEAQEPVLPPEVQELVAKYDDVFAPPPAGLPPDRNVGHTIPLEQGAVPPYRPLYRMSPLELAEAKRQIEDYMAKGWIEPSSSPYGAPILFVPKKGGELRMCIDYRALNKQTVKNRYPLPRIEDLFDKLGEARVFSSLDLAQGYHQIRVTDEDVPKTAFRTPFGHFQWRVLSFGLTNAPATFQRLMNDVFRPYLDRFVLVYLDDILVYSKSMEEHKKHLDQVLALLREHKLYAKPSKCKFYQEQVEYLGHLIGKNGISVDPKKVAAVQDWPVPQDVGQLRSFLGLTNYFRRFLEGYSTLVAPLTRLTRKDVSWEWLPACQTAFDSVKRLLVNAPVLRLPDFTKPFTVVTDASIVGLGAVLLQDEHPVAFESRKLSPAEVRYTTTEQEMLAVVHALRTWRCYLEGVQFTVVTDHNPITFFSTQQTLSRRQARWLETLSSFTFEFKYRPGRTNVADPLSRQPVGPAPTGEVNLLLAIQRRRADIMSRIRQGYRWDPWFKDSDNLKDLSFVDGVYRRGELVVVPDHGGLRNDILYEIHDTKYAGHLGRRKTRAALAERYWWPHFAHDVVEYIKRCDACARNKPSTTAPGGLLQPLPVPEAPWEAVSMDFITCLPETKRGNDAILVFVDRLTKMVHFAPTTTSIGAEEAARLFFEHVFRLHGLPKRVLSDRDARFTSRFWKALMTMLGTKQDLSSAFHPQTDGQTERVNRTLEQMLRMFVAPSQDDWDELLPAVEFACNNAVHDSTGEKPFVLNCGQHPLTPLDKGSTRNNIPSANDFVGKLRASLDKAKECLRKAQQRQKSFADKRRREVSFEVGDRVLLSTKNLRLQAPGARKLLPRYVGPFEVKKRVGEVAYKLDLPSHMAIHDVFHVSLLAKYEATGPYQPPPIVLDGQLEYVVERVLSHRDRKIGRSKATLAKDYLIKWLGYGHEHNSWEPEANIPESFIAEYWEEQATRSARRARLGR